MYKKLEAFNVLLKFIAIYGKKQKAKLWYVIFGAMLVGFLEMTGIILVFPLINSVVDPAFLEKFLAKFPLLKNILADMHITSNNAMVILLGVMIALVFIIKNVYMILFHILQNKMMRNWKNEIAVRLLSSYFKADYEFFKTTSEHHLKNNIVSVITDTTNNLILHSMLFISNFFVVIIIFSFLLTKYFAFSASIIIIFTTFIVIQNYFCKKIYHTLGEEKHAIDPVYSQLINTCFNAIKEIKILNCADYFLQSFKKQNRRLMGIDAKIMCLEYIPTYSTEIMAIICVIIMCVGVIYSNLNQANYIISSLGVLAMIAFRMIPLANRILISLNRLHYGIVPAKALIKEANNNYLQPKPIEKPYIEKFKHSIILQNVCYRYPNSTKDNIKDINLTINKGEFIGIIGPSGAGKTTLVDLISGLLKPVSGQILVDGILLNDNLLENLRDTISYVPQEVYIAHDTITNNVAFGLESKDIDLQKVKKALKDASILDHIESIPGGIEYVLGTTGATLSGGQKQRIAIARALYRNSEILILDEATAALDVMTEHSITESLRALKKKKTLIVIAHRMSTLLHCDRLILLKDGAITNIGTFDSLQKQEPDFKKVLKLSGITIKS